MAISPRRSSRPSRTSQPTAISQQHTQSSASSVSSTRPDRNARSHHKMASPRGSLPARSQSADDLEDAEKPQPRRTRSTLEDQKTELGATMDEEVDETGDEDVTRCICGDQEYPGLPVANPNTSKTHAKSDPDASTLSEDSTGWFIQCDDCKVWQHGGCVGILDESNSPENYFCEQCRKDLHKIMKNAEGRKYSLYLPVQDAKSTSSSPEPKLKEASRGTRDNRTARMNAEAIAKGRRATMNSRDSKYDEDEQLLRAIEESKRDSAVATTTSARGIKGKRSRSESEEAHNDSKRQRTISGSSSSQSKNRRKEAESDEEAEKEEKYKHIRGAAARNHKAKQERERGTARESEKTEAVSKRKGRGDKGRGDDSDPSPEPPSRTTSAKGAPANDTSIAPPPIPDLPAAKSSHHKKTGRPPAKRGRVGRNQYTKDRDPPLADNINGISPARSHNSHEGEAQVNGNGYHENSSSVGKPSRPRIMHPVRTTMNEMKRRVAGILEFISHTQVEMAGVDPNSSTKTSTSTNSPPDSNGADLTKVTSNAMRDLDVIDNAPYGSLSAGEMMDVLTRHLIKWQQEYGKYGDK